MSSSTPYRDETHAMAGQQARLEAEVRMLRRSVRELSAMKKVDCPRCNARRKSSRRWMARIARALALWVTLLLTLAGCAVRKQGWVGCPRAARPGGFTQTVLAFAGFE